MSIEAEVAGSAANDEPAMDQPWLTDEQLTDEELTALALAAAVDSPVGEDAVPLWDVIDSGARPALLPEWYMPAPMGRTRLVTGWPRRAAMLVIVAFLAVNAVGLCSTYGII